MNRRRVLVVLTSVVAGCNAGLDGTPTTETGTETPTAAATDTPTETATPTPTDTPSETATETATPGGPERAGNAAIAEVVKTLNAAVATYGGPDSDSILGVDASSSEFRGRRVEASVAEAETELETARERAVTRTQQRTVDRLAVAIRFLDLATQVQVTLTNAFFALDRARARLADDEPAGASDSLDRMASERQLAVPLFERIRTETDAAAVSVVDRIDVADYEAKVAQFGAEISEMARLRPRVDALRRGVETLKTARLQAANNSDSADDTARRAVTELEDAAATLRDFRDSLPTPADSLLVVTQQLIDVGEADAAEAREIAGMTPTPTPTSTATTTETN